MIRYCHAFARQCIAFAIKCTLRVTRMGIFWEIKNWYYDSSVRIVVLVFDAFAIAKHNAKKLFLIDPNDILYLFWHIFLWPYFLFIIFCVLMFPGNALDIFSVF